MSRGTEGHKHDACEVYGVAEEHRTAALTATAGYGGDAVLASDLALAADPGVIERAADPAEFIETWIKISGYPYRHEVNYTRHSYVIQHDMGKNWSLYMAELYGFLFEEFGLKKVEFDLNHNSLDFVVDIER